MGLGSKNGLVNFIPLWTDAAFSQSAIAEGRTLKNYTREQEHVLFSNMSWIETTASKPV